MSSPTLHIRNLPWTIASRQMKEYFSEFGHVKTANVVFDKITGMSRGYGFVTFSSKEACESVLNKKIHSLEGRVLTIETAV